MSISMNPFYTIKNLNDIKELLFPKDKINVTTSDVNLDRWNWDTSKLFYEDDTENKYLWLNDCIIALSPFNDTLIIGRDKTLSIFHSKFSYDDNCVFNLINTITLPELDNEETLTSILLLPFVSHKKSDANFREWTAIVCGFSSGYFRIYTENGKVLMSQLFHDEPILNIKCRTYSINHILSEQTDEILIIYSSALIQIDGFALCQTLRLYRNRLVNSEMNSTGLGNVNMKEKAPFTFKKWAFQTSSNGQISDCVNVCSFSKNDFDALVSYSINGKTIANDFANLFFTTGTNHYVGFYRAREGATHTIIDELSQFLVNRFKNVFSFFHQPKEPDAKEKIKPSTSVPPDLSLFDERLGLKICLSPNRRLSAVTDNFGRVILFDMQNSIAIRIWKGYRQAEVGWIVVEENINDTTTTTTKAKLAQFLVIYVPRRGILEIWCAQNGPRVTAYQVGKSCKLLYIDHNMFGLNHLILQNIKQIMNDNEYRGYFAHTKCFLLNLETGIIYNFNIPFLCSLTDRNSKKTRDVHILKDLKILLQKEHSPEMKNKLYEDAVKLILMLKTSEIRRESIDFIRLYNDPNLILFCVQKLLDNLLQSRDKNELDFENKLIAQMCVRIAQLCKYYLNIQQRMNELQERFRNLIEESKNHPDIHQFMDRLEGWSSSDVLRILSLMAFRQSVLKSWPQDEMSNHLNITICEVLSHFTLYYNHLVKHNQDELYDKLSLEIILMKDVKGNLPLSGDRNQFIQLDKLSCFLFWATFCGDDTNLEKLLNEVCIFPSNLLLLLFNAFLHSECSVLWPCWELFSRVFMNIVNILNDESSNNEDKNKAFLDFSNTDDHLSSNWTDIIILIYKSTNITSALIAINMIKAFIHKIKLEKKEKELNQQLINEEQEVASKNSGSDNEWETLYLDKENLNLVAKQLEDLFLLDLLLKSCKSLSETAPHEFLDTNNTKNIDNISLSFILTSGPGIVSEIVARWAVYYRIKPDFLVCSPRTDANISNPECNSNDENLRIESNIEIGSNVINESFTLNARSTLIEILDHVQRCFPNCLDSDILLINCFWEILLQWNRKPLLITGELPKALEYLEKVSSSVLKHNVLSMGWRLFFQKRMEILCNLIEKMGKKPKDRIIRKELDMDENNLEQFVDFCCDLLELMIKTSASAEIEALPVYTVDDWWQGFNSFDQYNLHYNEDCIQYSNLCSNDQQKPLSNSCTWNIPLVVMAMNQKVANIDLLNEYYDLADSVRFIVIFSLRNVRPLSLFPSSIRAYFFKDLYNFLTFDSQDSIALLSDPVLKEIRMRFLEHIISSIVQAIPVSKNHNEDQITCQKFYTIANKWFGKVIQLAKKWSFDVDRIRLQYVYDLFLYGCDPLAQELMATVSETKNLGRKLLIIAGMRFSKVLHSKYSSLDEISFLAPNVLFWLKSLVIDPNCFVDASQFSIQLLLENISNFLYDDIVNYRICQELLTALKSSNLSLEDSS